MRILKALNQAFIFVAEAVLEIFSPNHDNEPYQNDNLIDHKD
jgi:hypothetical protein